MHLYLGVHRGRWLEKLSVPMCVSLRTMEKYRDDWDTHPKAFGSWILDSGAYTEIVKYGDWRYDPDLFGGVVTRILDNVATPPAFCAPQDMPCEMRSLSASGLTVVEHQEYTIESVLYLRSEFRHVPWIPILQGWELSDYVNHVAQYLAAGIDLTSEPLVGLGSVCRRCRGFVRVSRWGECAGGWECPPTPCLIVDLGTGVMILTTFSVAGWESWGLGRKPLIREGMPVLIDEDLRFEDDAGTPRPTVAVNRWLRELPVNGAPAHRSWRIYAEALFAWLEFLSDVDVAAFGGREELRSALSAYAGHRLCSGPLAARWEPVTWNLHTKVLAKFYRWAVAEGHAQAEPFSYTTARHIADGVVREYRRNLAMLRTAKPHTTIKYLDAGYAELFVRALGGLLPDGREDEGYRGRYVGRNAAMGELVLASGLRRREFTHLLVYEVPPLPARRTAVPVLFPVGHGVSKGQKQRTSWIDYDVLSRVHDYIALERAAATHGSKWTPVGEPLLVEEPDWEGGRINGYRRPWRTLTPAERLRLVAPDGGSCLLAVQANGAPFVDWATVFRRTSRRIQARFEPRFPLAHPHRLRHTFAMRTLELLVNGYYRQAAELVRDGDADAGLALYLTKADPLMVLRDLLGHSSATTTELYLRRLDVTRIYRAAYERAGRDTGLVPADVTADVPAEITAEVAAEFTEAGEY